MYNQTGVPLIGVITSNASQSEQRQLLEGITAQAREYGAVTAIFSNIYNSEEYFADVQIENKIYDLILSKRLDGLILAAEAFLNDEVQQQIYRHLIARTDIPIIVTGAKINEFTCIDNNVETDLEDVVNHLIEVHGFTDIDLLTGWPKIETTLLRINGYRKALESHGITFDPDKVIYGNFWMNSGEDLAMEYISGKRPWPQAIACANDYMAYGLCDAFLSNGIRVPEQVTVVGYEYVGERFYHEPILTTYQRNRKAIGAKAVSLLWEKMTGEKTEPISVSGHMVLGSTCACGTDLKLLGNELQTIRREQFYSKLNLVGNFEQQLTVCRSTADYVDVLQQFAYLIRDIDGLHLCLYENWCSTDVSDTAPHDAGMMVHHRIVSNLVPTTEPVFYHKYDLFPDAVPQSESGDILYFCPIFFSGREFGYFILQYDHPDCYDIIFRDWLKIASNALEFLRMKNDIGTLLECRNLSESYDSLTGLYNDKGLRDELSRSLKQAEADADVTILLVRTELFFDHIRLDRQELSVRMDRELAENLKKVAISKESFCAKLADKLYALVIIGSDAAVQESLLADKLHTLILHAPLYSEHCGMDSLVICSTCVRADAFHLDDALRQLREQLNQKTTLLTVAQRQKPYTEYAELRNILYRNPQKKWDVQESCREFHLSPGHFRAVYKELFGISFHQDIIRSKVAQAKYLLLTTALSIPAIAYKCGYEDDKYFLRQFRQLTGMTPHVYKSGIL